MLVIVTWWSHEGKTWEVLRRDKEREREWGRDWEGTWVKIIEKDILRDLGRAKESYRERSSKRFK